MGNSSATLLYGQFSWLGIAEKSTYLRKRGKDKAKWEKGSQCFLISPSTTSLNTSPFKMISICLLIDTWLAFLKFYHCTVPPGVCTWRLRLTRTGMTSLDMAPLQMCCLYQCYSKIAAQKGSKYEKNGAYSLLVLVSQWCFEFQKQYHKVQI